MLTLLIVTNKTHFSQYILETSKDRQVLTHFNLTGFINYKSLKANSGEPKAANIAREHADCAQDNSTALEILGCEFLLACN